MHDIQKKDNYGGYTRYTFKKEDGSLGWVDVYDETTRELIDTLGKSLLKESFLKKEE